MKVVIIYCVKAFYDDLKRIYNKVGVGTYSEFDVKAYNKKEGDNCEAENWFATHKDHYDSTATFAFVEEAKSDELLKAIEKFNAEIDCCSPMHAYLLNVEKFI